MIICQSELAMTRKHQVPPLVRSVEQVRRDGTGYGHVDYQFVSYVPSLVSIVRLNE